MKKIISTLLLCLILLTAFGVFTQYSSDYLIKFTKDFNYTVTISTNVESAEEKIQFIEKAADQNNISFIKEVRKPKNSRYGKTEVVLYTFLNDDNWFKESFKTISIKSDNNLQNSLIKVNYIDLLVSDNINIVAYENINPDKLEGDYHLKGNNQDIANFIDEISNSDLAIEIVANLDFSTFSNITFYQAALYIITLFIFFISIIFALIIYNGILSKEIAISLLFGYRRISFIVSKIIKIFLLPILLAFVLSFLYLYYQLNPASLANFFIICLPIIIAITAVSLILIVIETILLTIKIHKINIVSWLKGYRKTYSKSSYLIKITSFTFALLLAISSLLSLVYYLNVSRHLPKWEKAKNYASVGFNWPVSYVIDDAKFNEIVVPKLINLWDRLDDNGAILFNAPFIRYSFFEKNDEYTSKFAFNGKYAFVNMNYLNLADIKDLHDQNLSKYSLKDNEWIIFVPENIEISLKDREDIKKLHERYQLDKEVAAVDTYVSIKKNQLIFPYDSQLKIENTNLHDHVLILINGKELDPVYSNKLSSLINGKFHPYIHDYDNPYDSIAKFASETGAESYILGISSVYNDVLIKVNTYLNQALTFSLGFIISLIILAIILKIDQEVYYYNEGQRIDVSRLLGYDFISIHKTKLIKNSIAYLTSFILLLLLLNFFNNRVLQSYIWDSTNVLVVNIIIIMIITIFIISEILLLKKGEKNIIQRLKEGV